MFLLKTTVRPHLGGTTPVIRASYSSPNGVQKLFCGDLAFCRLWSLFGSLEEGQRAYLLSSGGLRLRLAVPPHWAYKEATNGVSLVSNVGP
jgi:hypothetical protein